MTKIEWAVLIIQAAAVLLSFAAIGFALAANRLNRQTGKILDELQAQRRRDNG